MPAAAVAATPASEGPAGSLMEQGVARAKDTDVDEDSGPSEDTPPVGDAAAPALPPKASQRKGPNPAPAAGSGAYSLSSGEYNRLRWAPVLNEVQPAEGEASRGRGRGRGSTTSARGRGGHGDGHQPAGRGGVGRGRERPAGGGRGSR